MKMSMQRMALFLSLFITSCAERQASLNGGGPPTGSSGNMRWIIFSVVAASVVLAIGPFLYMLRNSRMRKRGETSLSPAERRMTVIVVSAVMATVIALVIFLILSMGVSNDRKASLEHAPATELMQTERVGTIDKDLAIAQTALDRPYVQRNLAGFPREEGPVPVRARRDAVKHSA